MKGYRKSIFLALGLLVLAAAACEKPEQDSKTDQDAKTEQDSKPEQKKGQLSLKTNELDVKSWDKWIYFSLKDNKVVEVTDPMTDTKWDLGFHLFDLKTNGGESTSCGAKGAAAKTEYTEIKEGIKVDGVEWVTDVKGIGVLWDMMGSKDTKEPINTSLTNNIIKMGKGMPPSLEASQKVWLIKDAEGKVVAFRVKSFGYEPDADGNRQMMLKFEYAYLPE